MHNYFEVQRKSFTTELVTIQHRNTEIGNETRSVLPAALWDVPDEERINERSAADWLEEGPTKTVALTAHIYHQ